MSLAPLPFQHEPALTRLRRRAVSIGATAGLAVLLVALLPLVGLTGVIMGILRPRTRFGLLRTALAATWAALLELYGVARLTWGWLRTGFGSDVESLARHTHAVQNRWTTLHLQALQALFTLPMVIDGVSEVRARPTILLMRHTSMLDTILPPSLIVPRTGARMRYVLKRELLVDPCLDIAGNRIPNVFVRRGVKGAAAEEELRNVQQLAETMGDNDVVVLFPEGTRASAGKRARAVARLEERATSDARSGHLLARAKPLRHLMPIRLGGAVALLRGRPDADVVFVAHTGLEELAGFSALTSGSLVGTTLRVRFSRAESRPAAGSSDVEFEDWLLERWLEVDRAVGSLRAESATEINEELVPRPSSSSGG
ncbi:MAG: 1-acyl-sn-glycerol-3-phosphate acyltransferase [Deltaproteobacteria bacterium]|nr:1-acyl-sn-glycerol-3-phosphate acyltransferase [Deltaproteobacteria bacterium]